MAAWNLRPIASALWRNRTGALLVAFQIAIGLAVLVNAVYVVKQRVELIGRPTGMDTANMIWVSSAGFAQDFDYDASWREDIAVLRALPGVKAASLISNIPLSGGGSSSGFQAKPGEPTPDEIVPANTYEVDEQGVAALGIKLSSGRNFEASEILPAIESFDVAPQAIVTKAFAKEHVPGRSEPGRQVLLRRPRQADRWSSGSSSTCTAPGSAGTSSTTSCCTRASRTGRRRSTSCARSRAAATR